jgi:glycosyltransferase involved in cell wall biosynthesis
VAKFSARKNHQFLIDAMENLPPNFKLLLAGPPSDPVDTTPGHSLEDIERMQQDAVDRGLGDRVEIHPGFVDAADYMKAGDVFMMPTEQEGMGTPLLEALVSGLPVVANATEPSLAEYVVDGHNGYLSRLDEAEWAEAVKKAAAIDSDQRLVFSKKTSDLVSTTRIDADYYRLLEALSVSKRGNNISVAEVLKS